MPNDDLDIQLLWLIALEERGINIDTHTLSEYWVNYVVPHWAEYGTAKINMRAGLQPPVSGSFNNTYKDSCGSFIRSEIWACIAPGCPQVAAQYAYEDAIIDHGGGEGVYAEVFCAALESAAFVINDIRKLINIGLSYIPENCGVANAIKTAIDCYDNNKSWQNARDEILEKYRGRVPPCNEHFMSKEDVEKGFVDGILGYDVPSNIGILITGLLYGEGDFAKTLCTAVNCGEDTDCTAATAGSIFGIMHGYDAIPEKWIEPIGKSIKTVTLNLGDLGYFGDMVPADINNLTERTEKIAQQVIAAKKLPVDINGNKKADLSNFDESSLFAGKFREDLFENFDFVVHKFDFFDIAVGYGDSPKINLNEPKSVIIKVKNKYRMAANLNFRFFADEDVFIPPETGSLYVNYPGTEGQNICEIELEIIAQKMKPGANRLVAEFTIDGRPGVMLVPIVLMN
jgi:ADP-ribosylglycohydrolase